MSVAIELNSRSITKKFNTIVGKVIRRICDCNYKWAKANYFRELERSQRQFKNTPLLVYQMGKVGSTTIIKSLKAINLERPIYHLHFLDKERILKTEEERKAYFLTDKYPLLKRPWLNEFILKKLGEAKGPKWKVITLTREPVSRNISAFFENLEVNKLDEPGSFEISSHYYKIPSTVITMDRLNILEKLFLENVNHSSPEQFFELEIKGVLGVDVFARKFPQSKGYCICNGGTADILLMRVEDLNNIVGEAFAEFFGISDFKLANANIGAEKSYAPLYREFKKNISLPEDYLSKIYGSMYIRHFYSPEEIDGFKRKWSINKKGYNKYELSERKI